MKKIGFVGVFDKTDLILCISKILTKAEARVLFIDATSIQKTKYVIPTIMPTISYLTDYQGIDIAVGFGDINQVKEYCGIMDLRAELEGRNAMQCRNTIATTTIRK